MSELKYFAGGEIYGTAFACGIIKTVTEMHRIAIIERYTVFIWYPYWTNIA